MNQLYKLLAESQLRAQSIAQIHEKSARSLPKRIDTIIRRLQDLSRQIRGVGIGKDAAAEREYLNLLVERRVLEQSFALHNSEGITKKKDQKLQKALDYACLVLDIYQDGVLVKGAAPDISAIAEFLAQQDDSESQAIAGRLNAILG